jgi:NAD(P)-dependent dehydrogenase (short-subunit alcohol dehydrogenase family)
MNNLRKKVVLVTGTSSGFGMLTVLKLCSKRNYHVYASMRNLNKSQELLNRVKEAGGQIDLLELDVTNNETIKNAVSKIKNDFGYIDVLINNAGIAFGGFFEDLNQEEIRIQMETNFFGAQNVIREVLPLMHIKGSGRIINISSVAGLIGYPCLGAYNASKWALEGFSESLNLELAPFNIKVILVEPGSFKTKIFDENALYTKNVHNKESNYYEYSQYILSKRINELKKFRPDPDIAAKKIVELIEKKNPKFRNVVGLDAKIQLIIKKILPYKLFSGLVAFFAMRKIEKS